MYVNLRILTPSEVRSRLGYDPLTDEQTAEFATLAPQQMQLPAFFTAGNVQKADTPPKPRAPDGEEARQRFTAALRRTFDRVKPDLCRQIETSYAKAMEAAEKLDALQKKRILQTTLDELNFDGWAVLLDDAVEYLGELRRRVPMRASESSMFQRTVSRTWWMPMRRSGHAYAPPSWSARSGTARST